ncbi:MAG: hypothetical protein AB7V46_00015 [Thermomicrobiales bacterium]
MLDTMVGLVEEYGVEGAICSRFLSDEIHVLVDAGIADSSDDARFNAVIGEEFAHIQIHQGLLLTIDSVESFLQVQADPYWPRFELDARNYSAAIRMPCQLVEDEAQRLYPEIADEIGFGQTRQIERALTAKMARSFVVPFDDMESRLLNWPCEIFRRVERSVLDCSLELVGDNPMSKIKPNRIVQRRFSF